MTRRLNNFLAISLLGLATGCSSTSGVKWAGQERLDGLLRDIRGPKRVVAVGRFTTLSSLQKRYGDWEIGGGMEAMLATALLGTGKFEVVERARLDAVLRELELVDSNVVQADGAPKLGRVLGAQLMVIGAVTEFGSADTGHGYKLGSAGIGTGGSFEKMVSKGTIALDMRVIDLTTGAIVDAFTVEQPIEEHRKKVGISFQNFKVGYDTFMKTPIGEAAERAIMDAVTRIADEAAETAWAGHVADFAGMDLTINAGESSGVRRGDRFTVVRVLKTFSDPRSEKAIGRRIKELGVVEIVEVGGDMACGPYRAIANEKPQPGDIVHLVE